MRGAQRTSPSTAWLLPSKYYWDEDEIIVSAAGKGNYTINDYQRYFDDIDFPVGYEMRRDTENLLKEGGPGVEVHCLHGVGVSTVEKYNSLSIFSVMNAGAFPVVICDSI